MVESSSHDVSISGLLDMLKQEQEELAHLSKYYGEKKHTIESLRNAIMGKMLDENTHKSVVGDTSLSLRKRPESLEIVDVESLPDVLCVFERKPNIPLIKAKIEAGEVVEGARIVKKGLTLNIR